MDLYQDGHLPVSYIHRETDGTAPAESLVVFDNEAEKSTESGPCPLTVVDVVPDQVGVFGADKNMRVALAVKHLNSDGSMISYRYAYDPQSIFHNPGLIPGLFPQLFPYGRGGITNPAMSVSVPPARQIRFYLNYYDQRFLL